MLLFFRFIGIVSSLFYGCSFEIVLLMIENDFHKCLYPNYGFLTVENIRNTVL